MTLDVIRSVSLEISVILGHCANLVLQATISRLQERLHVPHVPPGPTTTLMERRSVPTVRQGPTATLMQQRAAISASREAINKTKVRLHATHVALGYTAKKRAPRLRRHASFARREPTAMHGAPRNALTVRQGPTATQERRAARHAPQERTVTLMERLAARHALRIPTAAQGRRSVPTVLMAKLQMQGRAIAHAPQEPTAVFRTCRSVRRAPKGPTVIKRMHHSARPAQLGPTPMQRAPRRRRHAAPAQLGPTLAPARRSASIARTGTLARRLQPSAPSAPQGQPALPTRRRATCARRGPTLAPARRAARPARRGPLALQERRSAKNVGVTGRTPTIKTAIWETQKHIVLL